MYEERNKNKQRESVYVYLHTLAHGDAEAPCLAALKAVAHNKSKRRVDCCTKHKLVCRLRKPPCILRKRCIERCQHTEREEQELKTREIETLGIIRLCAVCARYTPRLSSPAISLYSIT